MLSSPISQFLVQFGEIIELGAGCGLCGLSCLKLLQSNCNNKCNIYLTDYDPGSLKLLSENIELNMVSDSRDVVSIHVKELKWGEMTIPYSSSVDIPVLIIGIICCMLDILVCGIILFYRF